MYNYRVEYTYISPARGRRIRKAEQYFADNCQEAVNQCRAEYFNGKEMRVERVWKDNHGSWMAVNAWS